MKQIDLNAEDRADTADDDASGETVGRLVPNRIRKKLKHVSAQLEGASRDGHPTLVVIYDNTDLGNTMESDVLQALFGQDSVTVTMSEKSAVVSGPFFGRNQGLTKTQNTSVSAVAILDRSDSGLAFRVYRNPHAVVVLRPEVLAPFPVSLRY